MAKSASIEIIMTGRISKIVNSVKKLLETGWSFDDDGFYSYLPVGDNDDYDWQRKKISSLEMLALIEKKESKGEMVGVVLTWKDSGVGGEFLFRKKKSISIILSKNRKVLSGYNYTDVSWYLNKIIPVFEGPESTIESISWEECL